MSKTSLIIYSSAKGQSNSVMSKAVSYLHCKPENASGSVTIKDLSGLSTGDIASYLSGLTANTYDSVYVACATAASAAVSKLTNKQVATLESNLKAGSKGSTNNVVKVGTCGANATATEIVLASDASATDSAYVGMYLKTTVSGTSTYHYITAYNGTTKVCTVASTGTAVTDTSTYVLYTSPYIYVVGDASSNETSGRVAWRTLFPNVQFPVLVSMMGGYGTGFSPAFLLGRTATSAAAATLTETGAFTAGQFNSGTWYVSVVSATTGAGQTRRIISNTANVLTIEPWDATPVGAVTYSIYSSSDYCLWDKYLPYAVSVYLSKDTAQINTAFQRLLDNLNVLPKGELTPSASASLLKMYADRGKVVIDAINAGHVTA